jgi:predicted MarR family transcription regulator
MEYDNFVPSESSTALSAFEYTLSILGFGFSRWVEACMDAANFPGLNALDILVLHAVNHRARGRRLSEVCAILNIGDSYLVAYALKKLSAAQLIAAERRGRERHYSSTETGDRVCLEYRRIREKFLVDSILKNSDTLQEIENITRFMSHMIAGYGEAARNATISTLSKPKAPPLRTKK